MVAQVIEAPARGKMRSGDNTASVPRVGVLILQGIADIFLAFALFDFTFERRRSRERTAARMVRG